MVPASVARPTMLNVLLTDSMPVLGSSSATGAGAVATGAASTVGVGGGTSTFSITGG